MVNSVYLTLGYGFKKLSIQCRGAFQIASIGFFDDDMYIWMAIPWLRCKSGRAEMIGNYGVEAGWDSQIKDAIAADGVFLIQLSYSP